MRTWSASKPSIQAVGFLRPGVAFSPGSLDHHLDIRKTVVSRKGPGEARCYSRYSGLLSAFEELGRGYDGFEYRGELEARHRLGPRADDALGSGDPRVWGEPVRGLGIRPGFQASEP